MQNSFLLFRTQIIILCKWLRNNLFANWWYSLITVALMFSLFSLFHSLIKWGIIHANFVGDSREACSGDGACWVYIIVWIKRFLFGLYPEENLWRIYVCLGMLFALIVFGILHRGKMRRWIIIALLLYIPIVVFPIVRGGFFGLEEVSTRVWGGVFLTIVIATGSMIICFPMGILFALGRRSSLPVIRYLSVGFIELWRGVPLISVLFMAAVMFPLFLPGNITIDKLIRCIFGIALFEAAYMAEVIRGGLQAIPKKQYEAADALGLSYIQKHRFIILPQALTHVLPGIANTFIALFKDTPLVAIIGLLDLLGMMQLASNNTDWQGFALEGYVFVAFIFWFFCFTMSRYTQRLEKRLAQEGK